MEVPATETAPAWKTVGCTFPNTTRVYTYKYDPIKVGRELQVGDKCVVDTKNGPGEVTVAEVHETPKLNEKKFQLKEILSWVNPKHEV